MISNKLKQRFCKDYNIPIDVYDEDIFRERLELFGADKKYQIFKNMIKNLYNNDESLFLEDYNNIKDKAIEYIKNTKTFELLNKEDMSKFNTSLNIPQKDVYKEDNIGKRFISIDMTKANYTSLALYGFEKELNEFNLINKNNYKDFMKRFTNNPYFINSKYLRQIIFGNCKPKRQIKYEKWRMEQLVKQLQIPIESIYSFNNDEIILDANKVTDFQLESYKNFIRDVIFKIEEFTLEKIKGSDTYIKRHPDDTYELKCMSKSDAVFVYRFLKGEELTDNDYVFRSPDKRLARYLEAPELFLITEKENLLETNMDNEKDVELD